MSHLSLETIARLVDEQPSALDSAHLDACAKCRAELVSMREDVASLAALPDMTPSPDAWRDIEARLEAEGLLRAKRDIIPIRSRSYVPLARAAAVAVIFVGGALVGRTMASAGPRGIDTRTADANAANTSTQAPVTASNATSDVTAPTPETALPPAPGATESSRSVQLASTGNAQRGNAQRGGDSADNAAGDGSLRELRAAEDKYFSALSRYSEKEGTETADPNARLAALEGIVLTTRAALAQAPTDPVINGYHLTALAQRDAMLKQIKANPAKSW
jgi:hypothetical protein